MNSALVWSDSADVTHPHGAHWSPPEGPDHYVLHVPGDDDQQGGAKEEDGGSEKEGIKGAQRGSSEVPGQARQAGQADHEKNKTS